MISGATEQELEIANARAELLLEIKDKDKEIERLNKELEEYKKDFKEANDLALKLITNNREYVCKSIKDTIDILIEKLQQKENIIKEVREYITSYESIETIQQFDHNKNNKDLDYSTIDEMTRRYMMVHDKILKILDKENI